MRCSGHPKFEVCHLLCDVFWRMEALCFKVCRAFLILHSKSFSLWPRTFKTVLLFELYSCALYKQESDFFLFPAWKANSPSTVWIVRLLRIDLQCFLCPELCTRPHPCNILHMHVCFCVPLFIPALAPLCQHASVSATHKKGGVMIVFKVKLSEPNTC